MASGTGIRAAAILMAGLVGAAVIAPGVAFAQPADEPTAVCSTGETLDASGQCVTSPTVVPDPVQVIPAPSTGSEEPEVVTPETTTPETDTTTPEVIPDEQTPAAAGDAPAAEAEAAPVTTAAVTDSLAGLTGFQLPAGLPLADALQDLPLGNLDLGDFDIPDLPSSGTFTSPRDACLFLASRVNVPVDAINALSGQFASFCGALPGSFGSSSGYPDLPSLADALDRLCRGLKYTHGHHSDGRDDINCPEVSYERAQQILAEDSSDPNNLDGDNDGEACEDNPREYETVSADYDGYPQGGVATGDSAPGVEPGVAGALAGLALATVAGTAGRREERGDADRREETADR